MMKRFDPRRLLRLGQKLELRARASLSRLGSRPALERQAVASSNFPARGLTRTRTNVTPRIDLGSIFATEVVDLGSALDPDFAGIVTPRPELSTSKQGVDAVFLENAEEYYVKYQAFDYWKMLIEQASQKISLVNPKVIVEFGCGFGNSTLPLLDLFPDADIVATDISPNLLSILTRLVDARELGTRCIAAAMDAQKPYLRHGIADLVVGSAILHHLADPDIFVRRAMDVLKPGCAAIFFEPFEAGYAILRLICLEVAAGGEAPGNREQPGNKLARHNSRPACPSNLSRTTAGVARSKRQVGLSEIGSGAVRA
jgi:SAM-dependent methyltransferase